MCLSAASRETSSSGQHERSQRSQNPFSDLFQGGGKGKRISATPDPVIKYQVGKWHYITQRETNPICHFRSTAPRGEGRADKTTREGASASVASLAMHSSSWALWLICPEAVIYFFLTDPCELHHCFTLCAYKGKMHSHSDSLNIYIQVSFFLFLISLALSLPFPLSSFLCINLFWQEARREWIFIRKNLVWRRYLWYILISALIFFFLTYTPVLVSLSWPQKINWTPQS